MFRRRLPLSSVVFTVLALASAAAAFGLVRGYEARVEALQPSDGSPVAVLVVANPVERGQPVPVDALGVRRIPATFAPPGCPVGSRRGGRADRADRSRRRSGARPHPACARRRRADRGAGPARTSRGLRRGEPSAGLGPRGRPRGCARHVLGPRAHGGGRGGRRGAPKHRAGGGRARRIRARRGGAGPARRSGDGGTLATAGAFATLTVTVTGPGVATETATTAGGASS